MKKCILYIMILLIPTISSYSAYWKLIENLNQPYKSNYWLDVFFLPSNPQFGWICGFNGLVIRTTDAGNTWAGTQVPGAYHLESIHFVNPSVGYTSGVDGVFKSTNGGASWTNVSDPMMAYKVWGCYFITENDGMAVGGGCGDSTQYFWRTTNGGVSWSTFLGNEPNSGMTDVIIYQQNGLGYAVSSGKLWVTNDGGSSWTVFANSEVSNNLNRWQEEITKYGSSFLLPYSGWECLGGGPDGGMYFTTDNGASWNRASTGERMFGSFLLSETSGWVCGYNGAIYYTSNAGSSWVKKNCGVKEGNLDDIWFTNPTTGWVVGEGIYKFTPDTCKFNSDSLNFKPICYPTGGRDTIYLVNHSFDATTAIISINGPSAGEFVLVSPKANQTVNIPACDSLEVVVSVVPANEGLKLAYLNANISSTYVSLATLYAFSSKSTAKPDNYTLTIDTAFCNTNTSRYMYWTAKFEGEYIDTIKKTSSNQEITNHLASKMKISSYNTPIEFVANPQDTGWVEETFKVQLSPCDRDTTVIVQAYGISPIINAIDTTININCYSKLTQQISIPIYNSGNYNLDIANITNSNSKVKIKGFKSNNTIQTLIKPKKLDSLILEYSPIDILSNEDIKLTITSNDSTKVRGNKNPYIINVSIVNNYSILSTDKKDIELDTICFTDSNLVNLQIKNNSVGVGNYDFTSIANNCTYKVTPIITNKLTFSAKEVKNYIITLYPIDSGDYSLLLKLYNQKCNDSLSVNIYGRAVKNNYSFSISEINRIAQTDTTQIINMLINSLSSAGSTLDTVYLKNGTPDLKLEYEPQKAFIPAGTDLNLEIKLTTNEDKTYIDTILVLISGYCNYTYSIPVKIVSVSSKLELSDYQFKFDSVFCNTYEQSRIFTISNSGSAEDIITNIEIDDNKNFSIIEPSAIPITIEKGTNEIFTIKFNPIDTGFIKTKLRIYTEKMKEEFFEIEISGFYGYTKSKISISNKDFGKYQYCDPTIKFTLNIENSGNIADTIQIFRKNPVKGIEINNPKFVIQPGIKSEYEITISPDAIELFANINEEILFACSPCTDTLRFNYKLFMINMSATVQPSPIIYDNLWLDKTVSNQICFKNTSNDTLQIENIIMSFANPDFTLSGLPNPGYELVPADSIKFNVTFIPSDTGTFSNSIKINFKDHCGDSLLIPIHGHVPEEVYFVNFRINHYEQSPNDLFTISLLLDSALNEIDVDSVDIELGYDLYLLDFEKAFYKGTPVNFANDEQSFRTEIISKDFLKTKGTVLYINALALLSLPDTTSLCIKKINIHSKKKVISTYIDGFYQLKNYCVAQAEASKFKMINLNLGLISKVITNNNAIIKYNSDIDSPLDLCVYNYTGDIVLHELINIKGKGEYQLNLNELSSGVYFLNCARWGKIYLSSGLLIYK